MIALLIGALLFNYLISKKYAKDVPWKSGASPLVLVL
jgi:hypothetical protein